MSSEDTCLFFEELMDGRFSETYKALPEGHKEKIMAFIDELKRSSEKKDLLKKESECKRPMIIPQNPQEGRVFGYKPREDKKDDAPDATTPKEVATGGVEEGKSAKSIFNTPYEIIFRWNPDSRSTKLEGGDFKALIRDTQDLCKSLTEMGFPCEITLQNDGHYHLTVKNFDYVEDVKKWNLPNSIPVDHGENSTYTKFFNDMTSYLMHVVCSFALQEDEKAISMLRSYIDSENLDKDMILRIYPDLAPYLNPSK